MKKFVFISLILALVASVAFAQDEGSWSVGGSGEIGTWIDFTNRSPKDHVQPFVGAGGYNRYDWYGGPTGVFNLKYSKGDLAVGLEFDVNGDVGTELSYTSDTAAFQVGASLLDLFVSESEYLIWDPDTDADDNPDTGDDVLFGKKIGPGATFNPGRLWGYYKFLDGKIHLEAALTSRDTNYWISNEAVGNVFDSAKIGTGAVSMGWGFTSVDHHTYLVADFTPIDGLSVGFLIPGIYAAANSQDNSIKGTVRGWSAPLGGFTNMNKVLLKDSLKSTRFGAKYATGPVEVAFQFALRGESGGDEKNMLGGAGPKHDEIDSSLYLGGKYSISDQLNAGLAMEAYFDGSEGGKKDGSTKNTFGIAASFGYNAGAFSAGLEGGLQFRNNYKNTDAAKGPTKDKGLLGVRPQLSYNIVDNYLCLSLDAFIFADFNKDEIKNNGIGLEVTPELWFNIAGTGAGKGYWYPNHGVPAIILRYKVGGFTKSAGDPPKDPQVNMMDITFKWAF